MAEPKKVFLGGSDGTTLAELLIEAEEEGWVTGWVVAQSFPSQIEKALAWYDEVVQNQMLSYLDEATAAVERFGLRANLPDGSAHKVYSLHVSPLNEVSFRTSPVSPPSELPTEIVP
jgi:hypothetical protein